MTPTARINKLLVTAKDGKHWIKDATKNKGGLHRALHVPEGEKIPKGKVRKASHSKNKKLRKEAKLAITLRKLAK